MLGTDSQYEREDVVLSESVSLSSRKLSEKMVLGHALAAGRPLWNYIGTFSKDDDYTGIKPASVVGPLIAATIADAARPWIVDGFDLGTVDASARKEMSRLLGWHATHEELFAGEPWAGVATLFPINSRNALQRALLPPHLSILQTHGTPVVGLRDDEISAKKLKPFRVITIENAPCLNSGSDRALSQWVRSGGTLIASRDTGAFDELGRRQPNGSLWSELDLKAAPDGESSLGRGRVIAPEPATFAKTALEKTASISFGLAPDSGAEVIAYLSRKALLLHIIRHTPPNGPLTLRLPGCFHPATATAELFVPGQDEPHDIPIGISAGRNELRLTDTEIYCIAKIPLR